MNQFYCPWDKTWHNSKEDLFNYCRSGGWLDDKATFEDLEKRLDAAAGGLTMATNTIPVVKPWPENTPRPQIGGKDL